MLDDPATIEPALDLILISRHLERIGDHATNIAEDVIFMVSALDVRHHARTRRSEPSEAPRRNRRSVCFAIFVNFVVIDRIDRMGDAPLCVMCRMRPIDARWRPFCSERCRNDDLARWADGRAIGCRASRSRRPMTRIRTRTMATNSSVTTDRNAPVTSKTATSMADTLTVTDNRTGKQYELPIKRRRDSRHGSQADQDGARGLRTGHLRPGVHEHRRRVAARSPTSTATRASSNIAATRSNSSPSSSNYLETAYLIIFGELPTKAQLEDVDRSDIKAHTAAPREHQEADGRLPARRPPDGRLPQHGRRVLDVLSGRQADLRRELAPASRCTG